MSIVQYVGARYVPKWYENSVDGTANWEINVEYEPLTWVTSANNHLYLSKKTVPDNIGTPAQNTAYWLDMGIFTNGQTQQLEEEIGHIQDALAPTFDSSQSYNTGDMVWNENVLYVFDTNHSGAWDDNDVTPVDISAILTSYDQRITALEGGSTLGRRYIVIADSYGASHDSSIPFLTTLGTLLDAGVDNYYGIYEGSMGYVHQGTGGHNCLGLLQSESLNISNHNTITDIVITVGLNDYADASDIATNIAALKTYIDSEYPNAKIYFGMVGNSLNKGGTLFNQLITCLQNIYTAWIENGGICITNVEYIMHDARNFVTDGIHPNTTGNNKIANFINSFLMGGNPDYKIFQQLTASNGVGLYAYINNGITSMRVTIPIFGSNLTIPSSAWFKINDTPKLNDFMIWGNSGGSIVFEGEAYIDSAWHPVQFGIFDGSTYIKYEHASNSTWSANTPVIVHPGVFDTLTT